MVYGATIAFGGGGGNHTKHINAPCGQNRGFVSVKNQNVIIYNAIKPSKYNGKQFTEVLYCTLRGPGWERILDVVPRGTELGTQVKTGSRAGHTHSSIIPK